MVTRPVVIVSLVLLGASMILAGWVLEDQGYISAVLLELGATVLLIAPVVYVERLVGAVRDELEALRVLAEPIARPYEELRDEVASGWERTAVMEKHIAAARSQASGGGHTRNEVAELFFSGSPGERIFALGLMQGRHSLAHVDAILDAVTDSRSAFEQYHALLLVLRMWDSLDNGSQRRLLAAIDAQSAPGKHIRPGSDRHELVRQIRRRARTSPKSE